MRMRMRMRMTSSIRMRRGSHDDDADGRDDGREGTRKEGGGDGKPDHGKS